MRTTKTLFRLLRCAEWFDSSLGAHVTRYVFSCCGSFFVKKTSRDSQFITVYRRGVLRKFSKEMEPQRQETYLLTMCSQRRLSSACASAQSDQSIRCAHEETVHLWLSNMRSVKIQINLRECAGWSESSQSAHVRRYVFWHCGSIRFRSICFNLFAFHEWSLNHKYNDYKMYVGGQWGHLSALKSLPSPGKGQPLLLCQTQPFWRHCLTVFNGI